MDSSSGRYHQGSESPTLQRHESTSSQQVSATDDRYTFSESYCRSSSAGNKVDLLEYAKGYLLAKGIIQDSSEDELISPVETNVARTHDTGRLAETINSEGNSDTVVNSKVESNSKIILSQTTDAPTSTDVSLKKRNARTAKPKSKRKSMKVSPNISSEDAFDVIPRSMEQGSSHNGRSIKEMQKKDAKTKEEWTEEETQTLLYLLEEHNILKESHHFDWTEIVDQIPTRSADQIRQKINLFLQDQLNTNRTCQEIYSESADQKVCKPAKRKIPPQSELTAQDLENVEMYQTTTTTATPSTDSDLPTSQPKTKRGRKKSNRSMPDNVDCNAEQRNASSLETKKKKRKTVLLQPDSSEGNEDCNAEQRNASSLETKKKKRKTALLQPDSSEGNEDCNAEQRNASSLEAKKKKRKTALLQPDSSEANEDCNAEQMNASSLETKKKKRKTVLLQPDSSEANEDDQETPSNAYIVQSDPNDFYIEEEAYLYHNPPLPSDKTEGVLPKDLLPIPPPPPALSLPTTGKCRWSFDEEYRTYFADFSIQDILAIDPVDENFMLQVMERDDLTLISHGLLDRKSLNPSLWSIDNIGASLDQDFFHRLRRFDTNVLKDGTENIVEVDVPYSMRMMDYCRYLEQRATYFKQEDLMEPIAKDFKFTNHTGKEFCIDVSVSALYMIDLDIKKLLPELNDDFRSAFRFSSVLPGGRYCMMNKVTPDARPFMGPNLYITPPASFTHFHQDGHGTVDSGHLVISGYNEVVLLRRLTERHKRHALWLLTGTKEHAGLAKQEFLDGLYSEPHSDGLGEKPKWPTTDRIQECKEMGYCPSVIVLKPGQLIHIGKGRLHAFRKMSNRSLPKDDCHYTVRQKVINENEVRGEELCVSIAWDWMFRGLTARGIYREVLATLEAAILTRKRGRQSLAIPELSVLRMAQSFAKPPTSFTNVNGLLGSDFPFETSLEADEERRNACKGILPGLRYVVNEHLSAIEGAMEDVKNRRGRQGRVSLAERPNSHENPELSTVDPHGNSDFSCKLCRKELSNVYYHCDGCEKLLHKDFNLCVSCHTSKYYARFVQVHPHNTKRHATINHCGDMRFDRCSRCPCKNGPACKDCSFCLGCSCKCHTQFTLNFRLFDKNVEKGILDRVKAVAQAGKDDPEKIEDRYLDDEGFTNQRLDDAKVAWGHTDDFIL